MLIVYAKGITNALVSFRRIVVKNLRPSGGALRLGLLFVYLVAYGFTKGWLK